MVTLLVMVGILLSHLQVSMQDSHHNAVLERYGPLVSQLKQQCPMNVSTATTGTATDRGVHADGPQHANILDLATTATLPVRQSLLRSNRVGHVVHKRRGIPRGDKSTISIDKIDHDDRQPLYVDASSKTITFAASTTMERMLEQSVDVAGMIPRVVPELKGISVGGAISGTAIETSSFRYGQFNDAIRRIWVLTGDGSIIECTRDNDHKDLYYGLPGSYGTLGRVLAAEVECERIDGALPRAPDKLMDRLLVQVNCTSYMNTSLALSHLINACSIDDQASRIDFVEALQFPSGKTVVMEARVLPVSSATTVHATYRPDVFHEQWYYEKIEAMRNDSTNQLIVPLKAFIFRYDRGAFWMARPTEFSWHAVLRRPLLSFLLLATHNNIISRWIFRWAFTTVRLYSMLRLADPDIIQRRMLIADIYCPVHRAERLVELIRTNITELRTPLWLCPIRKPNKARQLLGPHDLGQGPDELLIDFGIYGRVFGSERGGNAFECSRILDQWAMENGARKMLYSRHSYSREEFWSIYNQHHYRELREKYLGDVLSPPDVFDKVVGANGPSDSAQGLLQCIRRCISDWLC
jgi:Delta24-sterol reductase